ncbi:MAG: polyprenyl synthetase family protein [Candidatus Promineifilaceae bacterium]|nr:polyprenyl synthetase family protein [Candidatus Promineifilaceae bacterium]
MNDPTLAEEVRSALAELPGVARLPSLLSVFEKTTSSAHPDWQIPVLIVEAVAGRRRAGILAAAAIACLQLSIMIADDILDQDPRGAHHQLGIGPAANLALAFQAAASAILEQASLTDRQKVVATALLSRTALATAVGQHLDQALEPNEANYWDVVTAKSTPFYAAAHQLGAVVGGAPEADWPRFHQYGTIIGELIQLEDDLLDALETPANPDWHNAGNNLLLVYAMTADHPDKTRFRELLPLVRSGDPAALAAAQSILLSAGAFSYTVHQLIMRYKQARQLLQSLPLKAESKLETTLLDYGQRLNAILRLGGTELSITEL